MFMGKKNRGNIGITQNMDTEEMEFSVEFIW